MTIPGANIHGAKGAIGTIVTGTETGTGTGTTTIVGIVTAAMIATSAQCLHMVTAKGTEAQTENGALVSAKRAWRAWVRSDHGERYQDLDAAKNGEYRCWRSSTNESTIGKVGEFLTGQYRKRCQVWAVPASANATRSTAIRTIASEVAARGGKRATIADNFRGPGSFFQYRAQMRIPAQQEPGSFACRFAFAYRPRGQCAQKTAPAPASPRASGAGAASPSAQGGKIDARRLPEPMRQFEGGGRLRLRPAAVADVASELLFDFG